MQSLSDGLLRSGTLGSCESLMTTVKVQGRTKRQTRAPNKHKRCLGKRSMIKSATSPGRLEGCSDGAVEQAKLLRRQTEDIRTA